MKNYPAEKIKNIAFLGHGGSGKTTLADAVLFYGKAADRIGKTQDGTGTPPDAPIYAFSIGDVGFVTALILKYTFPNAKIVVLGKTIEKLNYFQFADEVHTITDIPDNFKIDHAFECVGGQYCGDAINQIIDYINPEGSIALMGVSENNVPINTRMVLEKGLTLLGNSRSSYEDFAASIEFLEKFPKAKEYLNTIISDEIEVKNISDINRAFDADLNNEFKTIMKWKV